MGTLDCGYKLSQALAKQAGKLPGAMRMIKEVFESWKKVQDGNDRKTIELLRSGYLYGTLLFELATFNVDYRKAPGDPPNLLQTAEEVLDKVWEARGQKSGLSRAETLESGRCLGFSKIRLEKDSTAREVLNGVWIRKKEAGDQPSEVLEYGRDLGSSLVNWHKYIIAREILSDVWRMEQIQYGSGVYESPNCGYMLGVCLKELKRYQEAIDILEVIWEKRQENKGKENSECAYSLGFCLMKLGKIEKADGVLRSGGFEEDTPQMDLAKEVAHKAEAHKEEVRRKEVRRKEARKAENNKVDPKTSKKNKRTGFFPFSR